MSELDDAMKLSQALQDHDRAVREDKKAAHPTAMTGEAGKFVADLRRTAAHQQPYTDKAHKLKHAQSADLIEAQAKDIDRLEADEDFWMAQDRAKAAVARCKAQASEIAKLTDLNLKQAREIASLTKERDAASAEARLLAKERNAAHGNAEDVYAKLMAAEAQCARLVKALEACPLPSVTDKVETHYQRFYDWYGCHVHAALNEATRGGEDGDDYRRDPCNQPENIR